MMQVLHHFRLFLQGNFPRKVSITDIIFFLQQLAVLVSAGIALMQACDILEKSTEKKALQSLIHSLKKEIARGNSFFASISLFPQCFDELACQLVKMGEHTGKLGEIIHLIANYKEKNLSLQKKLINIFLYPSIIMLVAMLMLLIMFIFVIPRFADLFADWQQRLPWFSRFIFALSLKFKKTLGSILLLFVLFTGLVVYTFNFTKLKLNLHKVLLTLPLIKSAVRMNLLARFAKNLNITLCGGIPIIDALSLASRACDNSEFSQVTARVRMRLMTGMQLHQAMQLQRFFPNLMIQMIKVGEESGTLEQALEKFAYFYETQIDQLLNLLDKILEPLIILILGVLIGGIMIGIYLPIFQLGAAI